MVVTRTVSMPDDLMNRVQELAKSQGVSVNKFIRSAIQEVVDRKEREQNDE